MLVDELPAPYPEWDEKMMGRSFDDMCLFNREVEWVSATG